MAVIDQDNFSNISWHSDQAGAAGSSSSAPSETTLAEPGDNGAQSLGMDVDQLDAGGLDSEVLECVVSSPRKESEGGKDAFMSYLITTSVCTSCCLPLPLRLSLT